MQHGVDERSSSAHVAPDYTPSIPANGSPQPIVIILCGLIGSGKSTFARALQDYHPEYVRCNQDALGSRQAVQRLASASLLAGRNVIIDRTNVDVSQRATWVDLALQYGAQVQAVVFQTPLEICQARLALRTDHETLRDPAKALEVLQRFHHSFVFPKHSEGIHRIIAVTPEEMPSLTPSKEQIDAILLRITRAPRVVAPLIRAPQAPRQNRGRGRWQTKGSSFRGGRGGPYPPIRRPDDQSQYSQSPWRQTTIRWPPPPPEAQHQDTLLPLEEKLPAMPHAKRQ